MGEDSRYVYELRVVAFVDILGFKSIISRSKDDHAVQQRILKGMEMVHRVKRMNDAESGYGGLQEFGVQVTTFSDCAVISYPLEFDGGLFHVLVDLIHLQIDLLSIGFFIRGGITIGLAHHDKYNAFGPGVVDAYILESKKAIYPRMILSRETIKTGLENSPMHLNDFDLELFSGLIRKDVDGYFYLDYLTQFQEFDNPSMEYYGWLKSIREEIISNLNYYMNVDSKVYNKYIWMLNYWNETLEPEMFSYPTDGEDESGDMLKQYMDLRIDSEVFPAK